MNKQHTLEVNRLIHSIGLKYGLRDVKVKEIVESQFRFIHETIQNLKIDETSDEDLHELKTNFLLKHIGKLYTSSDKIINFRNRKLKYGK